MTVLTVTRRNIVWTRPRSTRWAKALGFTLGSQQCKPHLLVPPSVVRAAVYQSICWAPDTLAWLTCLCLLPSLEAQAGERTKTVAMAHGIGWKVCAVTSRSKSSVAMHNCTVKSTLLLDSAISSSAKARTACLFFLCRYACDTLSAGHHCPRHSTRGSSLKYLSS